MRVKKLHPDAVIPIRATEGSVGYDLCSLDKITIAGHGTRACIPTGISLVIPNGCYGRIAPRSGLAFKFGINVGAGVIDPDYRGEIKVILFNHGENDFVINQGDKIAQLILEKVETPEVIEVESLDETERGENGFGSTDKK